jgi:hypothetical protein
MAISVGDAVLSFIGDSSQLDTKFNEVQPNAEKAFGGAAEAVEEGTSKMKFSMAEAKGEARLLGEEFGVHLPRHVSNFIAKLPGVGEALSAAFSATAILFMAQALVQVTEKATNWIANNVIFTQAMKDSNAATVDLNKHLLANADASDKAKDALEKFGASGVDSLRLQAIALQKQIDLKKQAIPLDEQAVQSGRGLVHAYVETVGLAKQTWNWVMSRLEGEKSEKELLEAKQDLRNRKVTSDDSDAKTMEKQLELLQKQLETELKLAAIKQGTEVGVSGAKLKSAKAQAEVAEDYNTAGKRKEIAEQLENTLYTIKHDGMMKQLAILKENDANTKDAQVKMLAEIRVAADNQASLVLDRFAKQKDELQKNLQAIEKTVQQALPEIQIVTPTFLVNMQKGIQVAHDMGITLRQDLVAAYNAAKKAQDDFMASGIKDGVAQTEIANNILKTKKALEQYGQAEDKFKIKSHGIFQQLENDSKTGAAALNQWKQIGTNAMSTIAESAQGAITELILAQGSFGKAMLKATENVLASIASQALITGLFDVGKAYEASARYDYAGAAQYTTAAEQMFVVAALAGGTAAGMSRAGGGGSGSSNQQQHTSDSNTGQSNRSGGGSVVGVQGFAKGALITAPTLAIIGEDRQNPTEAVLPLDDEQAMGKIKEGLGGGGGDIHVHVNGLISPDNLSKVMKQMSKAVHNGQAQLTSSNSLRLTKRSA